MITENPTGAPSIAKIALALSKAQAEYGPLKKTKTAKVRMKAGGEYSYDYADLSDMIECTRSALTKNELALTQIVKGFTLETCLIHSSGEMLVSSIDLPKSLTPQEFGSALTYYRRYTMGPMIGVAAEEDDDGQVAQHASNKPTPQPTPAQAKKPAPAPAPKPDSNPKEFKWNYGKQKGTALKDIAWAQLEDFSKWARKQALLDPPMRELFVNVEAFIEQVERESMEFDNSEIPMEAMGENPLDGAN
jgi:hypothetical protein